MDKRPLGRSGLTISPLVFGGNVFGWTADEAASFRLLDAFVDAGFDAIDTADVYSAWVPGHTGGESETVIGRWLAARPGMRARVKILTKVGMWPARPGLSAANIAAACEDSLRRLQTDYIDLYQAHRDDEATPQDETAEAFGQLIAAGKVRAVGASNFTAERLASALKAAAAVGAPRYEALQPHYNLLERARFEGPLQDLCVREGLGVIPYYALASGFLTGKYRSEADLGQSPRGGGVKKYLQGKGPAVLAALEAVAARQSATPAQVALAWLLTRPALTAPIASATRPAQLDDLIKAVTLSLSAEDLAELDRASA